MLRHLSILTCLIAIATADQPLRILCWNIHHGTGLDGKLDLGRIAKIIAAEKPDLVALQEVDNRCSRSGKVDQCAELARLTGMTGHFGRAMDYGGGEYGQAILSRHPVSATRVHPLPGKGEPRIAMEADVSANGHRFRFVTTHLDLDPAQRLEQARALIALLEKETGPLVLCGDFNDMPASPVLETFAKSFVHHPKAAPAFTFPANKPAREIDFVFLKGFKPAKPLLVLTESAASDHRPLLAEIIAAREPSRQAAP